MTDAPRPDLPLTPRCWCGNAELRDFSPDYLRCGECDTLVVRAMQGEEISQVKDDESAFYGKNYYLRHVQEDYGLPDLETRARADLPERCAHWLRTFLKFAPAPDPNADPVRTLELGCGHGGFVAMLRWAGYEAEGLELSPWLTDRAREWFNVPMLTGRLEDQKVPLGSLAAVMLMDVLEHLPDPRGTMAAAARLLRPGGFLLVQTPCFPTDDGPDYATMVAQNHPFLVQLKPMEHLYLFSQKAVRRLFAELGVGEIRFEPPIFAHYDMFFTASAVPLVQRPVTDWPRQLMANPATAPAGRALLALLDLAAERDDLATRFARAEGDATARQEQAEHLTTLLREAETDRAARGEQVTKLTSQLAAVETDSAARWTQVETLTGQLIEARRQAALRGDQIVELDRWLREAEADRTLRGDHVTQLTAWLKESEADRAARLHQVEELTSLLAVSEADRAARGALLDQLAAQIRAAGDQPGTPGTTGPQPTEELTDPSASGTAQSAKQD